MEGGEVVPVESEVPAEVFDVVVYGTGIVESLLACALSQCGCRVLTLDRYADYGGRRTNMRWDEFSRLAREQVFPAPNDQEPVSSDSAAEEGWFGSTSDDELIILDTFLADTLSSPPDTADTTANSCSNTNLNMLADYRKFNLELNSKLLYSSGEMLDVLLNSGVYRYLEFVSLESIFFVSNGPLAEIPFSKGEVFQSKDLSMVEKRTIMKFLQFAGDFGRHQAGKDNRTLNEHDLTLERQLHRPQNKKDFESYGYDINSYLHRPFTEFLQHCKMTPLLKNIIMYSLSLQIHENALTEETLKDLYLHIDSLGRYGSTAFLYPHYGLSELNQAFARMSAVWGCTQMLRTSIQNMKIHPELVEMRLTNSEHVSCRHLVASSSKWRHVEKPSAFVVTRTTICSRPLLPVKISGSSLLVLPPGSPGIGNEQSVFLVQHGPSSNTVPAATYVVRISVQFEGEDPLNGAKLLNQVFAFISRISGECGSVVLASVTTAAPIWGAPTNFPDRVYLCSHHDDVLHYETAVAEARAIFLCICPEKVFFERKDDSLLDEMYRPELDTLEIALGILENKNSEGENAVTQLLST